jgi:hypothetical protein
VHSLHATRLQIFLFYLRSQGRVGLLFCIRKGIPLINIGPKLSPLDPQQSQQHFADIQGHFQAGWRLLLSVYVAAGLSHRFATFEEVEEVGSQALLPGLVKRITV